MSLSNDKSNIIISQAIYDEVELQNISKPQFLNCKLQNEFSSVKIENP